MEYIDAKLKDGMERNESASRIATPARRSIIFLLAKHAKDSLTKRSEIASSISQSPQAQVQGIGQPSSPGTSVATSSTNSSPADEKPNGRGEKEWTKLVTNVIRIKA